ncbi:hypothetical protein ZIOFF_066645 [Zingiber officinale]|uniref:RRM domain-containing protein n=2 Tax=Zingiber officinale TaxID=94328 RepID=A0A8J5K9C6_ZINOF|nr:hypothetical protein ZIOFF_066645 [Zingiber officinale]
MAEPGDPDFDDSSTADATVDQASYTFLLAAIVFLFFVVSFVFLFYLYAKRHLRRPHVLVFSASDHGASSALPRGLEATVLRSIPVSVYRAAEFGNGIECAVCLCELTDGEAARILPKCGHGFHLECIDRWFRSHSTCPLCRSSVVAEPFPVLNPNYLVAGSGIPIHESPALPSDQQQTSEAPSSSSVRSKKPKGDLVIEIPRRVAEGFPSPVSPLLTSRNAGEEMRTPGSPRLRALRRRWSIGKRTPPTASACSPMGSDLEQEFVWFCGEGSDPPAKSPANSLLEITKPHEVEAEMGLEMAKGEEIAATTALVADSTIKRIFIGGLSATVTTSDMETTFSPLGKIHNVEFVRSDGRSFAFMDFEPNSEKSLAKLFAVYNGCAWKGGKLRLEKAKEHYLTRLQREWAEDASINVLDDLNAEKSSDHPNKLEILAHKSKCQNLENAKLQIYFPKLRKVKPVPFKGTGKHKYSFQRIEVPSLPIHFCDCEEHCGPSEMANETYMSALNSAAYNKERSIMTSVMNKFLEKEGNKVPEPGMVNFSKEGIAVDTAGGDVQLNETDEALEEDADNLVTNIGVGQSDDMLMQLLGKKTNLMDQVHESGKSKPRPSTDGHLRDKAHSCKRQIIASADTEVAPSQAARSIPVETDEKFASGLPKSKTEAILDEDSPSKMQTEHDTDSLALAKTNTWIQKSSWRDLVGESSGNTFSISTILPASKTLKANDSATKTTGAPKKRKMQSDMESSVNVEVKKAIVFEKAAASSSLRGDLAPSDHNVAENQSSHQGQKRSIPKINIGEVCTFMHSAQSEKEWSRAKAVLSGYIKKKGDGSHEAKAKPHRR